MTIALPKALKTMKIVQMLFIGPEASRRPMWLLSGEMEIERILA
ncbi:hypothetical protein [Planotetraspora mira]|nr:hypothetical protein [Planotetraspora mira]